MFDVIAMGGACFDFGIVLGSLPTYNQNGDVQSVSWQGGGKVATGVVATARQGLKTAYYGAIGGPVGDFILNDFIRNGVDVSHVIKKEGDSVLMVTLADRSTGGRNFLATAPFQSAPQLAMEDLDEAFLSQTKYLFVSDCNEVILEAIRIVHNNGGRVIVDMDSYNERIMANLKQFDIIIPSEFVYNKLYNGSKEHEQNIRAFKAQCNQDATVIFTLGENGLIGLDEQEQFFSLPAFKVDVMDTTGAGDVFHGAFVAMVLKGMDTKKAALYASGVSAVKCTRIGGRAGIPTFEVVSKFVETGESEYTEIDQRVKMYNKMPL